MAKIDIYIADDHQLLIDGLISALSEFPEINVIGKANDGRKVLADLAILKPNLLILDLNMPHVDGLQVIKSVKNNYKDLKILVLSNYDAPHIIKEVQQSGANGYLLKNGSILELVNAIETLQNDTSFFQIAKQTNTEREENYFIDDFMKEYRLTKREFDIMVLMARGKSTIDISNLLFISAATASTHRRNILKKLGIHKTSEIMSMALDKGWLRDNN